jgi:tRNA-splicing endonuclease subunit Sen54
MITGGSSGIGFAIAERFLQEGVSRVILVGRSYERLESAATRLERQAPESALTTKQTDGASDSVATRAPEEDQIQDSSRFTPGTLVDSSDRVGLLIGDVAEASSWTRELENAIVYLSLPH